MQPITIEPISYIALCIIIITLVYGFFSYRKKDSKIAMMQQKTTEKKDYDESPALVAAIAMMIEGKNFIIKRIIVSGRPEKSSSWRQFGRQETMRRRMNLQKQKGVGTCWYGNSK
jgi:hypothetical protein